MTAKGSEEGAAARVIAPYLARLEAMDQRLAAQVEARRSLDPARACATPLAELGVACLRGQHEREVCESFTEALCSIATALLESFPGNLFWDLDLLAKNLIDHGSATPDPPGRIAHTAAQIARLMELFGNTRSIRFRYVHDFTYGFDWARWVARDPKRRQQTGPFDADFLDALSRRAEELFACIDSDDPKYPRLRDAAARNPFPFSREPQDEIRLLRHLAANELIPARTWLLDDSPRWGLPFADLRVARARELGIPASVPPSRP